MVGRERRVVVDGKTRELLERAKGLATDYVLMVAIAAVNAERAVELAKPAHQLIRDITTHLKENTNV